MGNFAGSGDLKSFGDSFMRLSHDEILEKINLYKVTLLKEKKELKILRILTKIVGLGVIFLGLIIMILTLITSII